MRLREITGIVLVASAVAARGASGADIGVESSLPPPVDQGAVDRGEVSPETLVERGRAWFVAKFTAADGAGRPAATGAIVPTAAEPGTLPAFFRTAGPDASACRGCHNDPGVGGAGEFVANAFVSEGFVDADFDTVDPQFSNERGTPALAGAGFVELLAREMTGELRSQRDAALAEARSGASPVEVALSAKGVRFGTLVVRPDGFVDTAGLEGVDQDLVVRPFSQKGVFASIRQFTVNALNAHHGMQASERFGRRWTGSDDFDRDGVADEVVPGDVTALVAFQATLAPPVEVEPADAARARASREGERLFDDAGCGTCHRVALPLESTVFTEPGPYNPAGTLRAAEVERPVALDLEPLAVAAGFERDAEGRWLVPLYSDLKRHRIADAERPHYANELLGQRFVARDEFLTARLWGAGSTAPYGHRGDVTTLHEAVLHHGAEANDARRRYEALGENGQRRVIEFLLGLRIAGGDR